MNDRSIFSVCTGSDAQVARATTGRCRSRRCRCARRASVSCCSTSTARSRSAISVVSVISSTSSDGSRPASRERRLRRSATSSSSTSWRAERFTDTDERRRRSLDSAAQRRGLRARFVQDPRADRHDQAGLLGDREELVGRRASPRSGCSQRTSASKPITSDDSNCDERLVVHAELVVHERAAQRDSRSRAARRRARASVSCEHLDAAAAQLLGREHRDVASRSRRSGVSSSPVGQRDADARGEEHLAGREHERLGENGSHALGDGEDVAFVLRVVAHDGELVAAEARDRVAGAQDALDALRDHGEQLVAGREAEAVVDDLEVVEVEEHQPDAARRRARVRARERVGELLEQHDPVRQLGERIVAGAVREQRLDALVLGDVVHDAEQAALVAPVLRASARSRR